PFVSNAPPTPALYTLSLHDALPISAQRDAHELAPHRLGDALAQRRLAYSGRPHEAENRALHLLHHRLHGEVLEDALLRLLQAVRSEEHTSELQSLAYLVCRLLLEKK